MQKIRMSNFEVYALVDDEDYEYLKQFNWRLARQGYAVRTVTRTAQNPGTVYMHREVMQTPKGLDTDHRDMNKLNNQKANLRVCTRAENMMNLDQRKGGLSKYKGVSLLKRPNLRKPWLAYVVVNKKQVHLGYYATQEEAAARYNEAAKEYFGDYAHLNKIPVNVD